ncbi:putative thioredoxin [Synechococcus phage S-H38]|uniref:Putative thioredoxin n=1 Tax=Synechococcus phage S-H38 TaxID=2783673 RepID=A0A873WJP9_9CAUD|nr:thioredoxin domain [Synechococcus phage S-H38]QPB07861.1 putative thioredoxin [Synechococcus phage S-H38]
MNKFYLFSKKSCGPCALVDKYFASVKVDTSMIEKVDLEDFSDQPIPQENLDLAKKYGVTATPVLIIASPNGTLLESKTGGMQITQNIRKLVEQYA